jgi:hypothetical protein
MLAAEFQYPALYDTANRMSGDAQTRYLQLITCEYVALIMASIFALNLSGDRVYHIVSAIVIFGSVGLMATRNWLKPEQDWYRGRALAESIKTSCWKYVMRAEPFGDADNVQVRRAEFRSYLLGILSSNRHIGDKMPPDGAAKDQVTEDMERVRALPLEERKTYYDTHRIRSQRTWYAKKAGDNKRNSRRWFWTGMVAYGLALVSVLTRIAYPEWTMWPIEPLLVAASSVIGWMQVKKFNELASSYTLTAHEIGIIQGRALEATTEADFSNFVVEAEQAFSREHTQWVARQQFQ